MDIWKGLHEQAFVEPTPQPESLQIPTSEEGSLTSTENAQQEQPKESAPFAVFDSIPEQFAEGENELDWYKQRYSAAQERLNDPKFYEDVISRYGEQIIKREQEAEEILTNYKALKENPREFVRQYFPETLAELGITPVMNEQELQVKIQADLKKEFGEDYEDMYDEKDLAPWKGTTFSRKVLDRGNELYNHYQSQNARNKEIFDGYSKKVAEGKSPLGDEEKSRFADEQYEQHFKPENVSRADYDAFVDELKTKELTMKDLWTLRNHEAEVEKARKAGYEEGRKGITQEVRRAAQPRTPDKPATDKKNVDTDEKDFFSRRNKRGEYQVYPY